MPAFGTQPAVGVKTVVLFAPAGRLQIWVTQFGLVPGVVPRVPQPAAVVNTVWLFTPPGNAQNVWKKFGPGPTPGLQLDTGVTAGYGPAGARVHVVTMKFGPGPVPAEQVAGSTGAFGNVVVVTHVTCVKGALVPGLFTHAGTKAVVSTGLVQVVLIQLGDPLDIVPTVQAAELVAG